MRDDVVPVRCPTVDGTMLPDILNFAKEHDIMDYLPYEYQN
jgi:hypothetical protein